VAQARVSIHAVSNPAIRVRLESDLYTLLAQIEADSGIAPLAFTTEHAKLWEHLCLDPGIASVKQVDRQVYATAMYEGFTVAEPGRSEHSALAAIGVRLHAF
jgi:hypothetical protein